MFGSFMWRHLKIIAAINRYQLCASASFQFRIFLAHRASDARCRGAGVTRVSGAALWRNTSLPPGPPQVAGVVLDASWRLVLHGGNRLLRSLLSRDALRSLLLLLLGDGLNWNRGLAWVVVRVERGGAVQLLNRGLLNWDCRLLAAGHWRLLGLLASQVTGAGVLRSSIWHWTTSQNKNSYSLQFKAQVCYQLDTILTLEAKSQRGENNDNLQHSTKVNIYRPRNCYKHQMFWGWMFLEEENCWTLASKVPGLTLYTEHIVNSIYSW